MKWAEWTVSPIIAKTPRAISLNTLTNKADDIARSGARCRQRQDGPVEANPLIGVQTDVNSRSAAKAEKPAPNERSTPLSPGFGRPRSRISRKTNSTEGDDMLP